MEPDCSDCVVRQEQDDRMSAQLEAIQSHMVDQAQSYGRIESGVAEIVRRLDTLNGRVGKGEAEHDKLASEVWELKNTISMMKERKSANSQWISEFRPALYCLVLFLILLIFRNADLMIKAMGQSEVPKIEVKK